MIPDRRCLLSLCMISKIYALLSGPRPSRCLHRFLLQETMWVFSPCVVVVRGVSTEAWHAVLPPRVWATGPSLCNSVTSHFLPLFYPLLVCLSEFLFFQKKSTQVIIVHDCILYSWKCTNCPFWMAMLTNATWRLLWNTICTTDTCFAYNLFVFFSWSSLTVYHALLISGISQRQHFKFNLLCLPVRYP